MAALLGENFIFLTPPFPLLSVSAAGGGGSELWSFGIFFYFVFWWDPCTVPFQIHPAGRVTRIRGETSEAESLFSSTVCKASQLLIPIWLSWWEATGNDSVKSNEIEVCRQKRLIPLCPLVHSDLARNLLQWHSGLRVSRSCLLIPTAIWKMHWGDFSASREICPFLLLGDAEPSSLHSQHVICEYKTEEQIFSFRVLPGLRVFKKEEGFKRYVPKLPLAQVSQGVKCWSVQVLHSVQC